MKIEWSEEFKKQCIEIDDVYGWKDGEALEKITEVFDRCTYEQDLDDLDTKGELRLEVEEWELYLGPFSGWFDRLWVGTGDILNWDSYYAYRKTMFLLEAV